jgi:hypothetical protein
VCVKHVDPLLGNDREISSCEIALLSNGSKQSPLVSSGRNRHAHNNGRTVGSDVLCAARDEAI